MKRKNFTINEYDAEERTRLEKLYTGSIENKAPVFIGKDLEDNMILPVKIQKISQDGRTAIGESSYGQSIIIDIEKERKSLNRMGHSSLDLSPGSIVEVIVTKSNQGYNGSIAARYKKLVKDELMRALKYEDCAFKAKVESVCNGGFMVDVSGLKCFLPGSLAAANRILDFNKYVGKEINVMVEMYDPGRDTFVVSFKKYLNTVIDKEVQTLSFAQEYTGTVTGSSQIGVFVEWNEMFTGLIPFDEENKEKLSALKAGDEIKFYVSDIKNPQKIILSLKEPSEKLKILQELKEYSKENLGENAELKIYIGEITKIKTFGALVKMENGMIGLIEKEHLLKPIEQYEIGQKVKCIVSSVDISTFKIQLIEAE